MKNVRRLQGVPCPTDNRVENPEITTPLGNVLHAIKTGRRDHLAGQKVARFDQGALRRKEHM